MPQYRYTALDNSGMNTAGLVNGDSITLAAETLRRQGLSITSLTEQDEVLVAGQESEGFKILLLFSRVSGGDVVLFFRQLGSLLSSGVSVVAALAVLERQTEKRRLKWMIARMRRDVEGGVPLSEAMAKFPRVFPQLVTSMVRAGEIGGIIEEILDRLAGFIEERIEFRTQMINSLAYPALIFTATLGVVAFMAGFVIPRFLPFIEAQGGKLPWNTQFLSDLSTAFTTHWRNGAMIGFGSIIVLAAIYTLPAGRYIIDAIKLRIPVVGTVFRFSAVTQFSRALSSLLTSGIPLVESMRVTRDTVANAFVRVKMDDMVDDVMSGETLSSTVEKFPSIFPPMVGSMVGIGEETGNLEAAMVQVADIHEKMLRSRLRIVNVMIEPIMTVTIACLIGFVAWSLVSGILAVYAQ